MSLSISLSPSGAFLITWPNGHSVILTHDDMVRKVVADYEFALQRGKTPTLGTPGMPLQYDLSKVIRVLERQIMTIEDLLDDLPKGAYHV